MIRPARYGVLVARPRRADGPVGFLRGFGGRLRGSIDPGAVDSIAAGIQTQEGYYPGSRSYRNNNPGNLRFAGQPGASSDPDGFAVFGSYSQGLQALKNQISLDVSRRSDVNGRPISTLSDLLSSWAPPSENDTTAYIAAVSATTGIDPAAPLGSIPARGAYSPDTLQAGAGFDLSAGLQKTVDLSAVGLPADVPVFAVIGAGLLFALLLRG